MQAWEIVGYAVDGALYCPDHTDDKSDPLFAIDASPGDHCDQCLGDWIAAHPGEGPCTVAYLEGCEPEEVSND